jgi:hypothetical protein
MSSRRPILALVAAILTAALAALARPADAQAGAPLAAAARTVDSLRAVVERERELRSRVVPPHRIRSGLVTFLADTARITRLSLGTLRRAADNASGWVKLTHGRMAASTLGSLEIVVSEYREGSDRIPVLSLHVRGWRDADGWFARPAPARADELEDFLVNVASVTARSLVSDSIARWNRDVPGRLTNESGWRDVSIWLSSAQSDAARRCLAGRVDSCASALELDPVPDRLAAWYAPGDYPALVEHWTGWGRVDSLTRAEAMRCARTGDAGLCAKVVTAVTIGDLLPALARRTLFSLALETGGPSALERLAASHGSTRTQLAAAAGVPADSLLALWQARVMASRPSHLVAIPALATLGWTLLFAVASLRRPRCE